MEAIHASVGNKFGYNNGNDDYYPSGTSLSDDAKWHVARDDYQERITDNPEWTWIGGLPVLSKP
jgi:hypothetical protein